MLIIIPGWMHVAAQWEDVSELLRQCNIEHRILDLPGFGAVPYDEKIKTFAHLCSYVLVEIKQITDETNGEISLFGHSCGGRIALKLVADGLVVKDLILVGSPNLYRPDSKTQLIKVLTRILSPVKQLVPEIIKQRVRSADFEHVRGSTMQDLYADVVKDDQTNLLSKVNARIDLIWGEDDDAAPLKIAAEMHQKLPNSSLHILPNLGHNLHQENPRLLTGKIISILSHD